MGNRNSNFGITNARHTSSPPFKTRKAKQERQRYAETPALLRSTICYLCLIGGVSDQLFW